MNIARKAALAVAAALIASSAFAQLPLEFFLPSASSQGKLIRRNAYTLQYNLQHKQADWVVYQLTRARTEGAVAAPENWRPDPETGSAPVQPSDLQNSGYDRGLLVPAGDLKWSKTAAAEAYLMSNVSPMKSALRRGLWAELERLTRSWAAENEEVYVVAGPVLKGTLSKAGKRGISAPESFFKVILDNREPDLKAIAFILSNGPAKQPLMSYAVSIDKVEALTGLNLFPSLPDQVENALESRLDTAKWSVSRADSTSGGTIASPSTLGQRKLTGRTFTPAVMCKGVAAEGKRCVRMTTNPNGYCWEHQDQAKKK
ncbi:MAG: DNA/RNA non-specific endonuclease [Candidatus Latescibacterota bacterium]